ncbi:NADH2 dehydrogenase family protein [Hibiscus syriacus]|uniref:NADH2 dehydrogenase family protein n=1 Tax=Hibiscus syriacus TaxID=106335 RepID=A0A6A2Y4A0_HIBSY|nr:zinc finger protein CONSTANS-LIKE 16-like [Hibiscus syriacus]KAE8663334.1 NADH2 dehydrogenase family protein [Hibiscus syriacus]
MITNEKAANAVGGKTARSCEGCLQKRARWYCAADDAFLCQGCDTSVHSANLLASRHERVRLETASSRGTINRDVAPAWDRGFARKSRTPRQNKAMWGQQKGEGKVLVWNLIDPLVPEVGSEEGSVEENDEQLLCRVPAFDSFSGELCNMVTSDCDEVGMLNGDGNLVVEGYEHDRTCELDGGLHSFLASDLDLAEFTADVESFLGVGPAEDSIDIKIMKVKEEGTTPCFIESAFDVGRASLNWSFDYEDEPKAATESTTTNLASEADTSKRNKLLRLNYESVINAWTIQRSPWTTGTRPQLKPDDFMLNGGIGGTYRQARGNKTDGEREARVSRYREKRRTRLFSKKIRYEVRKLNAEKRPRMKGRFAKRTSFVGLGTDFPYRN